MDHGQGRPGGTEGQPEISRVRARSLLAGLAAACCCAAVQAAGEPERRLAAELVVVAGDVRRLKNGEGGVQEREGLAMRIRGALASLPMSFRRANLDPAPARSLYGLAARADWGALSATFVMMMQRHPFDARSILVAAPTPEMLALGATIHRTTCAGCHSVSAADRLLPAKNLAEQLAGMPREEFAARLLLGVRGDKTTAWRNPFSDFELAALIAHYSNALPAQAR